jgi:serine/threonine-protein kinase
VATDSDLLFVVLAVKLGFAHPVPAEEAETLEESLSPVARVAVRAAVAAYVAMSGGDATRAVETLRHASSAGKSTSGVRTSAPPRYKAGAEIRRDGFSRVLEGHDPELKRDVTLKTVRDDVPTGQRERLSREAELLARLQHPNILPVYDLGRDRGAPLVAMMRARGADLATVIRDLAAGDAATAEAWPRARLLETFAGICQGVAYAHSKGVIHRELRPSIVVAGDFGEVVITDWSSAKEKGSGAPDAAGLSQDPALAVWRSPERSLGSEDEVDERSDVYALGAILYALLSFRPPFEGADIAKVLKAVNAGVTLPPSKCLRELHPKAKAVPAALDKIALKALSIRRVDRHQDAAELLAEIRRFQGS